MERLGGLLYFRVDGRQYSAKGQFTYNLGAHKRTTIIGVDGVHGYSEMPQAPYVEGEITDRASLDWKGFTELANVTVTLELANGKTAVFRNATYTADGERQSDEANGQCRFEAVTAEELAP